MTGENFVPLMIATFALAYASFMANKDNKNWLIITFIIWLLAFLWMIKAFG